MKQVFLIFLGVVILLIILNYISAFSTDREKSYCELPDGGSLENINWKEQDSVTLVASTLYKAGTFKKIMQGSNYREAWQTPVRFPVVFLDTLKGGMLFRKVGGGRQTLSTEWQTGDSTVYSLRSLNKDPSCFITPTIRKIGFKNIVVDGISAQHPYGATVVASLSDKLGILHSHPRAVFIPVQDALDTLNEAYGNKLYFLEYETKGPARWTPSGKHVRIVESDDLQEMKSEGYNIEIDKKELIKARLFDFLIGDWDRHAEQWGWALSKVDSQSYMALPLPVDRDNAFYNLQGITPFIISNMHPHLVTFKDDIDEIGSLVKSFDRYFLLNTPESLYVNTAQDLQKKMNRELIEDALKVWPKEIIELDGKEIIEKILQRNENIVEYAKKYHKNIQKKGGVDVPLRGSEDMDLPPELLYCFDCMEPKR